MDLIANNFCRGRDHCSPILVRYIEHEFRVVSTQKVTRKDVNLPRRHIAVYPAKLSRKPELKTSRTLVVARRILEKARSSFAFFHRTHISRTYDPAKSRRANFELCARERDYKFPTRISRSSSITSRRYFKKSRSRRLSHGEAHGASAARSVFNSARAHKDFAESPVFQFAQRTRIMNSGGPPDVSHEINREEHPNVRAVRPSVARRSAPRCSHSCQEANSRKRSGVLVTTKITRTRRCGFIIARNYGK